jgi:release factor glutamine methyltransferase
MEIYWPQEDSFLMQDAIRKVLQEEKVKPERVLDLGTGSGILALEAARFAKLIDAVDINKSALEFVKQQIKALNFNNINVFYSDLFSNVKGKYDLIIFNPPYLPDEPEPGLGLSHLQKQDIIAGKKGNEIICKFLEQAKNFLNNDGKILFCCSSLSNRHEIENTLQKIGYSYEIIARKKLFFEELFVYLAKLRKS